MNNTKWNEIFHAFYDNECSPEHPIIRWRTKDIENGYWNQSVCPWNEAENTKEHKCAVKDTSICKYFCGIKNLDSVLCSYPNENKDVLN